MYAILIQNKMRFNIKHIIKIFSILSGCIFLLSGIGKSLATADFAEMIMLYGFGNVGFVAPLIAVAEIIIGLFLILSIYTKRTSFVAILFLLAVSIIYVYGYFRHNISDCGCFGKISILNKMSPWQIIVRNLLLIIMLTMVCKYSELRKFSFAKWKPIVIVCAVGLSAFLAGYSFKNDKSVFNQKGKIHPLINKAINETILPELDTFSADSSYVAVIFSYRCENCWNYIENLNRYTEYPNFDRIVVFAGGEDKNNEFADFFKPNYRIKIVDESKLIELVQVSPTLLYIKNDTIRHVVQGIVPSLHIFEKNYLKN